MAVTREVVQGWVARYEQAWRTPGTDALAGLFTDDAVYRTSPYAQPAVGLPEIAGMWEAERDGPDEPFTMNTEILAVDGNMSVVRVQVDYQQPAQQFRDLWVIRFADDGRCAEFEEWAYWPSLAFGPRTDEAAAGGQS